jgi:hypothetical protein
MEGDRRGDCLSAFQHGPAPSLPYRFLERSCSEKANCGSGAPNSPLEPASTEDYRAGQRLLHFRIAR